MGQQSSRRIPAVAGLLAIALVGAACGGDEQTKDNAVSQTQVGASSGSEGGPGSTKLTIVGVDDVAVTLTGPIAVKYASATDAQKRELGKPLTGDRNAGTRDSGVVYQQFQSGVIVAKNDDPGTPAYITTSGKIRDAWNTERAEDGTPLLLGKNGSAGPLGVPTSDVITEGDLKVVTFEYGRITENTTTGVVAVTVNGKAVPSGLK